MKILLAIGAFIFALQINLAQTPLIQNVFNRETMALNGSWKYIVDPYENGFYNYRYEPFENNPQPWKSAFFLNSKVDDKSELLEYNFDTSDSISVPGDWNTQKEKLFYYEGTIWYKKSFDYAAAEENTRKFIYIGAANYEADVYVNGKKLGRHIGGFTPFNFEITDLLRVKDNFVVIKVDNKRKKEAVPTLNTDWWNYGGLTRDIKIVSVPETFVQDYQIQLAPENPKIIRGFVQLKGAKKSNTKVQLRIPELKITETVVTDDGGRANIELTVKKLSYWSPSNPKLYEVHMSSGSDKLRDQIGFRSITTKEDRILLNNEPLFLKGISIHEESPLRKGRAYTNEDARTLLQSAKELGCNYVRLAHYPHNEYMLRLADEMGLLVWEENPVYWTITWENPKTFANAKNQLTEAIHRDKNRAAVIIWSMANETPTSPARLKFLTQLAQHTRELDPTRLISAALEQTDYKDSKTTRTIDDAFAEVVDVLSFNQYIGWYDGLPEKCRSISWHIDQNKPVLISEFGGGAKYGMHGEKSERWTEEFQAFLYEENLKMISKIPQVQGFSPWILMDFRSPRRMLPSIQDGWNRKGLLSEKGEKKQAYFVLQNFYRQR